MLGYREDDRTAGTEMVVGTGGPGITREADGEGGQVENGEESGQGKGQAWGRGKRKGGVG